MGCVTRIMQFLQEKLMQATRLRNQKLTQATTLRNHKLTYIQSKHPIAQLQSMNFTKTEVPIITICLPNNFSHGSVTLVLPALVHCSKPARFYDKH